MLKQNKWLTFACSVILLFLTVVLFKSRGDDYDIWWHLKYGEHYVNNLTFYIDHSLFSWTPSNPDWIYVTWIGSSVLYMVYMVAGFPGLAALQWIILLAIAGLYIYYCRSTSEKFDIVNIASLIFVVSALQILSVHIKPEMFTTIFFAFAVFIFFYSKSHKRNLFLLYPVLFLFWVNTHGAFIFGLAFITIAACAEIMAYLFFKKAALEKHSLLRLLLSVALSYLATLINPYGIEYHQAILNDILISDYMDYAPMLSAYQTLWGYFNPTGFPFRFIYATMALFLMALALAAACVFAFVKNRFIDIAVIILNIIFLFLAMHTARLIVFAPILWIFSFSYVLSKTDIEFFKRQVAVIALVIIVGFGGSFSYHALTFLEGKSWFGTHMGEWVPEKEAAYIKENKLPGPIFNDYIIGGYMIWSLYPEYKVFVDPRYFPHIEYSLTDWFSLGRYMTPDGMKVFTEKYKFKMAFILLREEHIINWLLSSPEWRLVYFDKVAAVIVHNSFIESMGKDALSLDLSASRFKDVTNPVILMRLFNFYIRHISVDQAREIMEIYRNNVFDLTAGKDDYLAIMELSIPKSGSKQR
jgi:hypothetical protein